MRVDRRTTLLLALLALAIVAGWRLLGSGPATPGTTAAPNGAAAAGAQAQAGAQQPLDVRIEMLSAERQEPSHSGRNPFQFRAKPAPPPPVAPANAFANIAPPVPAGPPPPPPITLKYIGLVQKAGGVRVAVLSDGRSQPVYGQQGDILLGSYRIVSIGVESIELEHQDGRGRQTIRLTGQ